MRNNMGLHDFQTQETFERIEEVVEENLRNPDFTVYQLASQLGISYNFIYKFIKKLADMSPNEFIKARRLDHAMSLIERNYNISVEYLSAECGFKYPSTFFRSFKDRFSVGPSKMMQIIANKEFRNVQSENEISQGYFESN